MDPLFTPTTDWFAKCPLLYVVYGVGFDVWGIQPFHPVLVSGGQLKVSSPMLNFVFFSINQFITLRLIPPDPYSQERILADTISSRLVKTGRNTNRISTGPNCYKAPNWQFGWTQNTLLIYAAYKLTRVRAS